MLRIKIKNRGIRVSTLEAYIPQRLVQGRVALSLLMDYSKRDLSQYADECEGGVKSNTEKCLSLAQLIDEEEQTLDIIKPAAFPFILIAGEGTHAPLDVFNWWQIPWPIRYRYKAVCSALYLRRGLRSWWHDRSIIASLHPTSVQAPSLSPASCPVAFPRHCEMLCSGFILICSAFVGLRAAMTENSKTAKLFMKVYPIMLVYEVVFVGIRVFADPSQLASVAPMFCFQLFIITYYFKVRAIRTKSWVDDGSLGG